MKGIFTSESVGRGHPDKICDQIADKILDSVLESDPNARVAIEVMASNRLIIIGGELNTTTYVDIVQKAWEIVMELGYSENDFSILSNVNAQSEEIRTSVEKGEEYGAGDQGIMFGYATNETPSLMPLPITVAHELVMKAEQVRTSTKNKWLKSDMKSQVSVDYSDPKNPKVHTVLMSIQHEENYIHNEFVKFVEDQVIKLTIKKYFKNDDYKIIINPSGKFVIGGPIGDTGLTGRKIIVDTYGGASRHGGGSFSGKDYTKVDRSAAYAARWVAKNLVAAGVAQKLEVQLSYGIGLTTPISIDVETFNSSKMSNEEIIAIINSVFDLSPGGIIKALGLKKPIYYQTSFYGHFGRQDLDLPWERLDKVDQIKKAIK